MNIKAKLIELNSRGGRGVCATYAACATGRMEPGACSLLFPLAKESFSQENNRAEWECGRTLGCPFF